MDELSISDFERSLLIFYYYTIDHNVYGIYIFAFQMIKSEMFIILNSKLIIKELFQLYTHSK